MEVSNEEDLYWYDGAMLENEKVSNECDLYWHDGVMLEMRVKM